jgi:drug/metabolite transporter (DMT)-like permease
MTVFKDKYPVLLLIIANMIWGGNFVIGRIAADYFPPVTFSLLRWLLAFLILSTFMIKPIKEHLNTLWKYKWILLLMSVTGIAGYNTIVYFSLHYTTSINASMVNSTSPLVIAIFSVFMLKEKLTMNQIAGILISFIGVAFIITKGSLDVLLDFSFNKGDLFILVAVVFWGIYSIMNKKYSKVLPIMPALYITSFIGVLILIPFSIVEMSQPNASVLITPMSIFIIAYVGILASIIAFFSWNIGVSILGPSRSGIYINLLPVFAAIFATVFTDETIHWYQIAGGIIVILGVVLSSKKALKPKKQEKHGDDSRVMVN